jgi:hypothetical protein
MFTISLPLCYLTLYDRNAKISSSYPIAVPDFITVGIPVDIDFS